MKYIIKILTKGNPENKNEAYYDVSRSDTVNYLDRATTFRNFEAAKIVADHIPENLGIPQIVHKYGFRRIIKAILEFLGSIT